MPSRILRYALLALVTLSSVPGYAATCEVQGKKVSCSKQVKKLVERVELCVHFAGEPEGDKERQAYIHQQLETLNCDRIMCDYTTTRSAAKPKDRQTLEAAVESIYRDNYDAPNTFFEDFDSNECPAPANTEHQQQ